jgi:hypothetical protein
MDPRTPKPSPDAPAADAATEAVQPPEDAETRRRRAQHLDQELDAELDDTFPASDPIPWSHEVK